jgi:hypothetical protein
MFVNDPGDKVCSTGTSCGTQVFIQYWLFGTNGVCPSTLLPNGNPWTFHSGAGAGCFVNSGSTLVPSLTASDLAYMTLTGQANYLGSGNDVAQFCVYGDCYRSIISDQVLNLYQYWTDAEFNIVGLCCSSKAIFSSGTSTYGTSITVVNSLNDHNGYVIGPSCVNPSDGRTAESDNLNLDSCSSYSSNGIVFTESNAPSSQISSTSVSCSSSSVPASGSTQCTATVTGSFLGPTPTGSVSWFQTGGGSFSPGSCTLTSGSCTVTYNAPPTQGPVTITAQYYGDTNYQQSTGTLTITITPTPYSATFNQNGISSGITWGVTVGGTDYTGAGSSITVPDLTGTLLIRMILLWLGLVEVTLVLRTVQAVFRRVLTPHRRQPTHSVLALIFR